jgi:hypothetical protein
VTHALAAAVGSGTAMRASGACRYLHSVHLPPVQTPLAQSTAPVLQSRPMPHFTGHVPPQSTSVSLAPFFTLSLSVTTKGRATVTPQRSVTVYHDAYQRRNDASARFAQAVAPIVSTRRSTFTGTSTRRDHARIGHLCHKERTCMTALRTSRSCTHHLRSPTQHRR